MSVKLEGSCRCGKVRFSADSSAPVPFMLCYCSICRKTAGAGGFAINLHADKRTLTVQGETAVFHAELDNGHGEWRISTAERHFCGGCASALWVFDPEYPEIFHPFASAIDSELPKAPSRVHMMLSSKASWVESAIDADDRCFDELPDIALEDWHRAHGLWID